MHVAACFLYLARRIAAFPRYLVERGLILAGGAAGIAAAFNAPIAGIVFAIEEIGRSFDKDNAGTIVRTVVVACLVCVVPLSDYLFYGRGRCRAAQRARLARACRRSVSPAACSAGSSPGRGAHHAARRPARRGGDRTSSPARSA